jgi:hypothetical protein
MTALPEAARFFSTDPTDGALRDRNGDGVADELRVRLVIAGTPTAEEWVALLALAARLGVETSALTLPLAYNDPQALPPDTIPLTFGAANDDSTRAAGWMLPDATTVWALVGLDPNAAVGPTPGRATVDDLATFYGGAGALADDDSDLFPERIRLCPIVPRDLPRAVGLALLDLAARLGLEATGLALPVAVVAGATPSPGAVPLQLDLYGVAQGAARPARGERSPDPGAGRCKLVANERGGAAIVVRGDEAGAVGVLRELAATWPYLRRWDTADPTAADLAEALAISLHGEDEAGRAAILAADLAAPAAETELSGGELRLLTAEPRVAAAARAFAAKRATPPAIVVAPDDRLAFVDEWTDEWEVDRARTLIRETVLPLLDPALPAALTIMIGEPVAVRRAFAAELSKLPLPPGSTVAVLAAFKPGLCWLTEIVGPRWAARGDVARVAIAYRPFVPPDAGRFLDLPIRHLQELFPGDEVLAGLLGIPLVAIAIEEAAELPETYRATAFDRAGRAAETLEFSPRSYARDYIAGAPDEGRVTVTTGAIRAVQGGRIVADLPLPTDFDRFWEHYQGTILPRVRALIAEETVGTFAADAQPFFEALDIEVWCSATDEALGVREELLSAAEALQQDLYFGTLDAIAALGAARPASGTLDGGRGGGALDAPGAVRPFVHVRLGTPPRARIALRRRLRHLAAWSPADGGAASPVGILPTGPRPVVRAQAFAARGDAPGIAALDLAVPADARLAAIARHLAADEPVGPAIAVELAIGDRRITLRRPIATPFVAVPGARDRLPATPLDVAGLRPLLARLASVPGVGVRRAGRSFEGREIAAIEIVAPGGGAIWSRHKASLHKPTMLIIARHHANEPASTHAALALAARCADDPAYRALLARTNVVILPLENVDGAALHAAMWREHPTWKLHAARYNAVGREFARDYYDPATPWGEARVRPRLWHEWLPDLVTDNHGVPSHEWNQHFNGYGSPPRFGISYWLVSALLYGILRFPTADPAHEGFARAARDRIARAAFEDDALREGNAALRDRYERWGHARLPGRFPADYHRDMLWFFGPQGADGQSRAGRPPAYDRVTVADIVTEVPDETAQGDYLALVAHAHLVANTATLALLAESDATVMRELRAGSVTLRRARPLRAPG